MRFMMLYKPGRDDGAPPSPEVMEKLTKLTTDESASGKFLATDGLQPSAKGARVRITNDGFKVTDGPFTEAKEIIAGYAILELGSKEEAIEHAKQFLAVMGEGETEVRAMFDGPPPEARKQAGATASARR